MSTIHIGTAGWSVPKQYASDVPSAGTHLNRYSKNLNCTEINSSFYRSHRLSTWAKWADSVSNDFRFSVKAPKTITHEASLACSSEQLWSFLAEAQTLAGKLGPILFQLPPKSAFDASIADTFFKMFRNEYSGHAVFEPRHPTWFTAEADHLLQQFQIARVAADPAPVPEAAIPGGWDKLIYYRLHGSPRMYYSEYTKSFLHDLAETIARQQETTEVWCIFDNTASGAALGDAQNLKRLLTPNSIQQSTVPTTSPASYR
jgi:uncharacterized protein YecE (DUF72 family)